MDEEDDLDPRQRADDDSDPDAMDWTPTSTPYKRNKRKSKAADGTWLKPQRFFPPEQLTGLENYFQKATLADISPKRDRTDSFHSMWSKLLFWAVIVFLMGLLTMIAILKYTMAEYSRSMGVVAIADDFDLDS